MPKPLASVDQESGTQSFRWRERAKRSADREPSGLLWGLERAIASAVQFLMATPEVATFPALPRHRRAVDCTDWGPAVAESQEQGTVEALTALRKYSGSREP